MRERERERERERDGPIRFIYLVQIIKETNKLSKKTIELSPSRYKKNFFGKYNKKGEKC